MTAPYDARARVAGIDTRQAKAIRTVQHASRGAAAVAAPGWFAAAIMPFYWSRWLPSEGTAAPWVITGAVLLGMGAALVAWRRDPSPARARSRILPVGADAAVILALIALIAIRPRDAALLAVLLPLCPVLAGWTIGHAARLAAAVCPAEVRSAATGIVVTAAALGVLGTAHLWLVLRGSGPARAATWALVYVTLSLISLARAWSWAPRDRARIELHATERAAPEHVALSLDRVTVRFGSNLVLQGATLSARSGELLALVGGNGAGKSTLLRVAAGLLKPETGRVSLDGEDVTALMPEERAAAGLAFVSGARPVFPDLTVIQNLRVAAFRTHLTSRSFTEATDAILELVPALAARRQTTAGVLSGGEQRLLAVAQTLYRRPKVLLADELSLGLDTGAREAVLDLLRVLADEGVAVVAVDHDLPALLPRADRAALLSYSSIVGSTPAASILDSASDLLPATFLVEANR